DDVRHPRLPRAGPPQHAARRRPARAGGRLRRGDVLGPLLAVERAPGPVGVRLVLAGSRAAVHRPALRRGQRARAALPPGDHRPGHRHARHHVPRPVLGGAGHRRGEQRAHHGRQVAAQGRAQRATARVRGRHPGAAAGRGGQPRRPGHRRPRPRLDPPGGAAAPGRRGRQRRHRAVVRGVGRRPDHRQPARRGAARDDRRLPRRGRARAAAPPGAPVLRPGRDAGRGDRLRPVAQQLLPAAGELGPRPARAVRRGLRERVDGPGAQRRARLRRPREAHRAARRVRRAGLRRDRPAPRRPGAGRVHRRVRGEGPAAARGRGV
ncbi:MAG: Similar to F420-dependent glucose-6-phosphate dehydrogenase, Mext_1273 family, partial [uncultured Pseudonocardia sp.]